MSENRRNIQRRVGLNYGAFFVEFIKLISVTFRFKKKNRISEIRIRMSEFRIFNIYLILEILSFFELKIVIHENNKDKFSLRYFSNKEIYDSSHYKNGHTIKINFDDIFGKWGNVITRSYFLWKTSYVVITNTFTNKENFIENVKKNNERFSKLKERVHKHRYYYSYILFFKISKEELSNMFISETNDRILDFHDRNNHVHVTITNVQDEVFNKNLPF